MVNVQSSNIEAMGYDAKTRTLTVRFSEGRTYEYSNVTEQVYQQITSAGSVGSAFSDLIRSNPSAYPYRRI